MYWLTGPRAAAARGATRSWSRGARRCWRSCTSRRPTDAASRTSTSSTTTRAPRRPPSRPRPRRPAPATVTPPSECELCRQTWSVYYTMRGRLVVARSCENRVWSDSGDWLSLSGSARITCYDIMSSIQSLGPRELLSCKLRLIAFFRNWSWA